MGEFCIPCGVQCADWGYFNLMHPVRGATVGLLPDKLLAGFQSTHPMRGATKGCTTMLHRFQSNAPHAGCKEVNRYACGVFLQHFNLTHPVRGATHQNNVDLISATISINAPRAGCNSKTIQFKRILVARRMYSFANYVLHTLKHSPIYCIGTTL